MFSDIRCCFLSWDRTVYANDDRNIYVLRQLFLTALLAVTLPLFFFLKGSPFFKKKFDGEKQGKKTST